MSKQQRNAGDEVEVKSASERDDLRTMRDADDMRKLLCEEWGRRLFWRLVAKTGLLKTSMTGNSHTFFLEGRRSIGIELWDEMESVAPEAYVKMVEEARNDKLA